MQEDIARILLTEAEIKQRVSELGARISQDYAGKDLVAVCILKGALHFMADLTRAIEIPLAIDFMAISSYGAGTKTSGEVRIIQDLDAAIAERHILIVEDIVDTGLTLKYLVDNLGSRRPASLKIVTLLDKPARRAVTISPDYNGFEIPDEFVVGYGLDYDEKYRNLPFIGILKPEIYQK
ncbi:MAG: hypoxanthine phosphoribosyltransferase [Firmicutes bacterium]|jgi:hypoxanthine phosphoribosyltransferase|nr:hypoxanthine phosphoribosyltransferase [Bacillota bacterium]